MKKGILELKTVTICILVAAVLCIGITNSFAQAKSNEIVKKKVIVLDENDALPIEVQKEITAMGVDLTAITKQLNSAKQGIVIKKSVDKTATITPYEGVLPGLGQQGSENIAPSNMRATMGVFITNDKQGAEINKVVENSAASEAGLKKGDIIIEFNGTKVTSNYDVIKKIRALKPGDKVKIKLIRNGKTKKAKVVLKAKPISRRQTRPAHHSQQFQSNNGGSHYGRIEDCEKLCASPFLGVQIQTNATPKAAKVIKVFPNTGAAAAKLQVGDLVTSIDANVIEFSSELVNTVQKYTPGTAVTINFIREGQPLKVTATISNKTVIRSKTTCDCEQPDFIKELDQEIVIIKKGGAQTSEEPTPTGPKISKTSNNTLEVSAVALYPNPNDGKFTIDFALEDSAPVTITVLDITGRKVFSTQLDDFSGNHQQLINISDKAPGSYLLNIIQEDKIYTKKIIISD